MLSKKIAMAALVAGLSGAALASPTITLNPSATNNGMGTVDAGQGPIVTDSLHGDLVSVLDIGTLPGGAATTWNESGFIAFTEMKLNNVVQTSGLNKELGTGTYDLYGVLSGGGTGFWAGTSFIVSAITSFSIKLYAAPAIGSTLTYGLPSSGVDATGGVTSTGNIFLGTALFSSTSGLTSATVLASGAASTSLSADFTFAPVSSDFEGVGGFFEAPQPFFITLQGAGSSTSGESSWAPNGGGTRITTGAGGNAGSATTTFAYIPEPGVLSLAGLALVGAAVASRRKAKVAVAA